MRTNTVTAIWGPLLLLSLSLPLGAAAQELPVQAAPSPTSGSECPSSEQRREAEPDDEARAEARELARSATEAALLGDPEEARDQLRRATELDPRSPELAYRRARAHEELNESDPAIRFYCRYLSLAPGGEDAEGVRERLAGLRESDRPATSRPALRAFREGVERLRRGRLDEAEARFTEALRADPELAEAHYNRGLARGADGRVPAAVRDLRAYLDARPDAPDRERVQDAVEFLRDPPAPHDPTRAFLLGAVLPGAGHFYTGRPVLGSLLLGAAGAGLAATFYEKVVVGCLAVPEDGVCPEGQVHARSVERPGLVPGLVTLAVAAGVSAVSAHSGAVSGNRNRARLRVAGPNEEARTSDGPLLLSPSVAPAPGGVSVRLVRLRF